MRHFFVLTHLGVDVQKWNKLLSTNIFLKSDFDYDNPKYYVNAGCNFTLSYDENKNSRNFDILVFNWQTGHKDTLDFSKVIYLENNNIDVLQNIRATGKIHRKYVESYYEMRLEKISQLLSTNKDHMIIKDDSKLWYKNKQIIADFLEIPCVFNQEEILIY